MTDIEPDVNNTIEADEPVNEHYHQLKKKHNHPYMNNRHHKLNQLRH